MFNKKNFKFLSIILTLIIIVSLISFKVLEVNANMPDKPSFDIEISASPDPAYVGEDILVSGNIIPKDFQLSAMPEKPKDIVLVIDETINEQDLLSAAISKIIESMNINSSYDKTRLGIISYSKEATIYKINNESLISIKNSSLSTLAKNINKSTSDIRNTGEALRKAEYLLHGNESNDKAEKIIILLSHREANARTVYIEDNKEKFYTNISKESYENSEVKTDSNDNNIKYANEIGGIIKNNKDIVYTIAYQSKQNNKEDNNKTEIFLKKLHETILGHSINKNYEENNFYICEDKKKVEEKFNELGKIIMQSYEVSDIKMNITFNQGFTMNIDGNTLDIRDIIYKLYSTDEEKSKNILKYRADKIPFEFLIKADRAGKQEICSEINITYSWNDEIVNQKLDFKEPLDILIKPNDLPIITAEIEQEEYKIKSNDKITIKYKIKPEDFTYNNADNSSEKAVLFLIDISNKSRNTTVGVLESCFGKLLKLLQNNAKYAAITFSDNAEVLFDFNYRGYQSGEEYANVINEKKFKQISYGGDNRNIDKAFNLVEDVFNTAGSISNRNIVIFSDEDINYDSSKYNDIKEKGYNIITLSYNSRNFNNNLYNLHKYINGIDDNMFFINNDYNSVNNSTMGIIKERLESFNNIRPYLINPILNINLTDNFEAVEGIEKVENNIATIKVPTVVYNLTTDNRYHADEQEVTFTIKAKNLSGGKYTLGNPIDNFMKYNSIISKEIIYSIKTPTIIVEDEFGEVSNLTHGLYGGLKNSSENAGEKVIDINENESEFLAGVNVYFGSSFKTVANKLNLELNIDSKFENVSNIKVYKFIDNTLEHIIVDDISIENNYVTMILDNFNDSKDTKKEVEILITYDAKIKDSSVNEQFINTITIGKSSKDISIYTLEETEDDMENNLPDLF